MTSSSTIRLRETWAGYGMSLSAVLRVCADVDTGRCLWREHGLTLKNIWPISTPARSQLASLGPMQTIKGYSLSCISPMRIPTSPSFTNPASSHYVINNHRGYRNGQSKMTEIYLSHTSFDIAFFSAGFNRSFSSYCSCRFSRLQADLMTKR